MHDEYELTGWEEHERDSQPSSNYEYCPKHPSCIISNGAFDAPCAGCEAEADDAEMMWQCNPENPTRLYCRWPERSIPLWDIRIRLVRCENEPEDDIPF